MEAYCFLVACLLLYMHVWHTNQNSCLATPHEYLPHVFLRQYIVPAACMLALPVSITLLFYRIKNATQSCLKRAAEIEIAPQMTIVTGQEETV